MEEGRKEGRKGGDLRKEATERRPGSKESKEREERREAKEARNKGARKQGSKEESKQGRKEGKERKEGGHLGLFFSEGDLLVEVIHTPRCLRLSAERNKWGEGCERRNDGRKEGKNEESKEGRKWKKVKKEGSGRKWKEVKEGRR